MFFIKLTKLNSNVFVDKFSKIKKTLFFFNKVNLFKYYLIINYYLGENNFMTLKQELNAIILFFNKSLLEMK
jgi:hypothetical protein